MRAWYCMYFNICLGKRERERERERELVFCFLCVLVLMVLSLLDFFALSWVVLWFSIVAKSFSYSVFSRDRIVL